MRKSIIWNFSAKCLKAFETLKEASTTAPALATFVLDALIIVETDASDHAIATILLIKFPAGEIHPVTFHSQTLHAVELNYDTHNKELLAIFKAFMVWQHYLEGSTILEQVFTSVYEVPALHKGHQCRRTQLRNLEQFLGTSPCLSPSPCSSLHAQGLHFRLV